MVDAIGLCLCVRWKVGFGLSIGRILDTLIFKLLFGRLFVWIFGLDCFVLVDRSCVDLFSRIVSNNDNCRGGGKWREELVVAEVVSFVMVLI